MSKEKVVNTDGPVTFTELPQATIYQRMAAITRTVEAIKKEKVNKQGDGFKYRGIDDVMNALHDAFSENGVFIMPEAIDRVEVERKSMSNRALFYVTQTIKFRFIGEAGDEVSAIVKGTAMDSGDKADNKCLSIGLKYALLQAFLIPTEELIDPDSVSHEVKTEPLKPVKRDCTDAIWLKLWPRIQSKETGIIQKIRETYNLTPDQEITLQENEF